MKLYWRFKHPKTGRWTWKPALVDQIETTIHKAVVIIPHPHVGPVVRGPENDPSPLE